MSKKTTREILRNAEDTLVTAKHGLMDLKNSSAERKLPGLRNLIVFGRAVTNVLQNLRSTEGDHFENWYVPFQEEMQSDPVMRYFYKLRSIILKQGTLNVQTSMYLNSFDSQLDMRKFGVPPKNAKSFFMGDEIGGSGWEVQISESETEKYYVDFPADIGKVSMFFPDFSSYNTSDDNLDNSVESYSDYYFNYLSKMVKDAKKTFK